MLVNLKTILKNAHKDGYAVGLFNTTDTDLLQAVISAAEERKSPVIIGTAEILLPYADFDAIGASMINIAQKASVPVTVHFDHGLTFERCMKALKMGFTGVMFDGSALPYEENVRQTREIVKIAHSFGAGVEGEIGHVGEADNEDNVSTNMYTTVDMAKQYAEGTGVDALAIAIGTAHGAYKSKPKLDFERLASIRSELDIPLVLHGGSGLSDDDFRNSVKYGISKVNIFTDLCTAAKESLEESFCNNFDYLTANTAKIGAVKSAVGRKMELFGSCGRG